MSVYDSNLPVAPEFCVALKETATKTAIECLKTLSVPAPVIALVECISDLGYYLEVCGIHPEDMQVPANKRFPIEAVVIDTINAIAVTGGIFEGPWTNSAPRPTNFIAIRTRKRQHETAQA